MEPRRKDWVGPACFHATVVLTLWALVVNNISLASGNYTWVVIQAVCCSVGALALIAIGWRRFPLFARVIAGPMILACGWTVLDAGLRRLPSILGW
jgi:hypothetical protein